MSPETAILLIDGNNLNLGFDRRLDLKTFKEHLESQFNLLEAHYFFSLRPVMEEESYLRHQTFVSMLVRRGYRFHQHQMRRGMTGWKGDCDIDIALVAADAFNLADWVILVTQDSDFSSVIDYGHRRGKKVAVVSFDEAPLTLELQNLADRVIDVSQAPDMFFDPTAETRNDDE